MVGRATVDRRATAADVLRDMRADINRAQFLDEVGGVVAPVRAERDRAWPVGMRLDHLQRRQPLGMARDAGEPGIDDQARAVLHQSMADETQLRLHPRPLLVEHGIGIGAARMGCIRALLAPEIGRRIAASRIAAAIVLIVPGPEALHASPSLYQRAIDAEVIARQQLAHAGLLEDCAQELPRHVSRRSARVL